jgi:hypothetical protein
LGAATHVASSWRMPPSRPRESRHSRVSGFDPRGARRPASTINSQLHRLRQKCSLVSEPGQLIRARTFGSRAGAFRRAYALLPAPLVHRQARAPVLRARANVSDRSWKLWPCLFPREATAALDRAASRRPRRGHPPESSLYVRSRACRRHSVAAPPLWAAGAYACLTRVCLSVSRLIYRRPVAPSARSNKRSQALMRL